MVILILRANLTLNQAFTECRLQYVASHLSGRSMRWSGVQWSAVQWSAVEVGVEVEVEVEVQVEVEMR